MKKIIIVVLCFMTLSLLHANATEVPTNDNPKNHTTNKEKKNAEDKGDVILDKFDQNSPIYFYSVYHVDVTGSWTGYIWQGWLVSGQGGGIIELSESYSVSNGYSNSFGASTQLITAEVGYSVTYTRTRTASYSRAVTEGKWGHIGLDYRYDNCDYYDVIEEVYTSADNTLVDTFLVGSGSSWEWSRYAYYYEETTLVTAPPSPHS